MTGAACYDQHAQRDSRERRTAAATFGIGSPVRVSPQPAGNASHLRLIDWFVGDDNARASRPGLIEVKHLSQQLLLCGHGSRVPADPA